MARALAAGLRGPSVRSLGLPLASGAQVSFNLIDPAASRSPTSTTRWRPGPGPRAAPVVRAELVGLVPEAALRATPRSRWAELDLGEDRTIEFRMVERGLPTGAG